MKKKGFTLIELLAVVTILGVIAVIAVPVIDETVRSARKKSYITQLRGIEDGAKNWAAENMYSLPSSDDSTPITLTLEQLVSGGYVQKDIKNPMNNEPLKNITVTISYENGNLVYTLSDEDGVVKLD